MKFWTSDLLCTEVLCRNWIIERKKREMRSRFVYGTKPKLLGSRSLELSWIILYVNEYAFQILRSNKYVLTKNPPLPY